jgi:hypothetical protein
MKKLVIAAALAASVAPSVAYAMTYFLTDQWYDRGSHFCRYSNGTVLNVGIKLCPLSIEG